MSAVSDDLFRHPRARALYPDLLVELFAITRSSPHLLNTAGRVVAEQWAHEPMAPPLTEYLHRHASEESGHDRWVIDDFERVGGDAQKLLARPASPHIVAMIGAQYYWIHNQHPVAILGYLAFAEGYPVTLAEVEALAARTGYPTDAFTTYRRHSDVDLAHSEEIFSLIDELPLTPAHLTMISVSALHTAACYTRLGVELCARFQ